MLLAPKSKHMYQIKKLAKFSRKATKICRNLPIFLTIYVVIVFKEKRKSMSNFCDFLRILELYSETKKIANNDFGLENELVSGFISSSLRGLLSFA